MEWEEAFSKDWEKETHLIDTRRRRTDRGDKVQLIYLGKAARVQNPHACAFQAVAMVSIYSLATRQSEVTKCVCSCMESWVKRPHLIRMSVKHSFLWNILYITNDYRSLTWQANASCMYILQFTKIDHANHGFRQNRKM